MDSLPDSSETSTYDLYSNTQYMHRTLRCLHIYKLQPPFPRTNPTTWDTYLYKEYAKAAYYYFA